MTNIVKIAIIFFLSSNAIYAGIKIIDVKDKNPNDPLTGSFRILNQTDCDAYIIVNGLNTGYHATFTVPLNWFWDQKSLAIDKYILHVYTTCYFTIEVDIKGCNAINLNLNTVGRCLGIPETFGSATVDPQGGVPPYNIKWLNKQGQVIGTGFSVGNLFAGDFIVTVMDNANCVSSLNFKIEQMARPTVTVTRGHYCYDKDNLIINVKPPNREYIYIWNDGLIEEKLHLNQRVIPLDVAYSLQVIDKKLGCGIITNDKMGVRKQDYNHIFELTTPFNPPSSEIATDGVVNFRFKSTGNFGRYPTVPLIVDIYKNDVLIGSNINLNHKNWDFEFRNLGVGDYEFEFSDFYNCPIGSAFVKLRNCIHPSDNPAIEIVEYNLPPGKADSYIKAKVTGVTDKSKCKYTWYQNFAYNHTTTLPEIDNVGLEKLLY